MEIILTVVFLIFLSFVSYWLFLISHKALFTVKGYILFFIFVLLSSYLTGCLSFLKIISFVEFLKYISPLELAAVSFSAAGIFHCVPVFFCFIRKKITGKADIKTEGQKEYTSKNKAVEYFQSEKFSKPFIVFCVTVLVLFVCELTVFNYSHYAVAFTDNQIKINEDIAQYNNMEYDKASQSYKALSAHSSIDIELPPQRIAAVYFDVSYFKGNEKLSLSVRYADDEAANRSTPKFNVVKNNEKSRCVLLNMSGKCRKMTILFSDDYENAGIKSIELNKVSRLNINYTRMALICGLALLIWLIKTKKLMDVRADFKAESLTNINVIVSVFAVVFLLFTTVTSVGLFEGYEGPDGNPINYQKDQYNGEIVDALLMGQIHLDIEVPQSLLDAERPYDVEYRNSNKVEYEWDHVYYNGKYYSYYGIVPVLTLSLPFRIITGQYIPTYIAVFIFCAVAAVFLILIFHTLVKKYLKDIPLIFYILAVLTLAFCTQLPYLARRPEFYEVAIASGMCFVALGFWLLLNATLFEKLSFIKLFFASLSLAMAVGCKADLAMVSFLVPLFLLPWIKKYLKEITKLLKIFIAVAIPYCTVAAFLMWYNYKRFGSVFDFGIAYQMTTANMGAYKLLNPVSKLEKAFAGVRTFLFQPFDFSVNFPFVNVSRSSLNYRGYIYTIGGVGALTLPVCLTFFAFPYLSKKFKSEAGLLWYSMISMILFGLIIMVATVLAAGIHPRYETDFMWMFVLPALILGYYSYYFSKENKTLQRVVNKIVCMLMVLTISGSLLISFTGENNRFFENNTTIYYFIKDILQFWS